MSGKKSQNRDSFRENVKRILSPAEQKIAIYGFDVLGDMALIEIPELLQKKKTKIGRILLDTHARITRVYEKVGSHSGKYRVEKISWLAGEKNSVVSYHEWSCSYRVDPNTVFFNSRLGTERQRVASFVKKGETVAVFFGGVGPYAIALAKHTHPNKVYSIEWNPAAQPFLKENIHANKVEKIVVPLAGDIRALSPRGDCDHVVMPAPETAGDYLPEAVSWLKPPGGRIHYYFFHDSADWEKNAPVFLQTEIPRLSKKYHYSIEHVRKVSDFSPRKKQLCAVIRVIKNTKTGKPKTRQKNHSIGPLSQIISPKISPTPSINKSKKKSSGMFLVLIGVPGAGKGTVAQLFAKKGWVHFSMGAALRDHVKQNGKYAREVKSLLEKGHLAPDKIAYSVLSDYFSKFKNKKVIFDGFPRNMEQAKGAEKVLHSLEKDFDAFVFIDVPKKEVLSRLSSRRQCGACGKIYGATTPPRKKGICDTDGEKLVSRSDDKPSVIRERFRVYETETAPLLDWASTHYLIFRVDGMGKPTTVFKRVERVLSHIKAS